MITQLYHAICPQLYYLPELNIQSCYNILYDIGNPTFQQDMSNFKCVIVLSFHISQSQQGLDLD